MPGTSVFISQDSIDYINSREGKNFSAKLDEIVQEHRVLSPRIRRADAIRQLKQAASVLSELKIQHEAIFAWVRAELEKESNEEAKMMPKCIE